MAAQLDVALGGMLQGGSTTMSGWAAAAAAAAASIKKRKSAGYWEEERDMVVQLMMGRPLHHHLDVSRPSSNTCTSAAAPPPSPPKKATSCTTLDLLGSATTSSARHPPPLPFQSDDASSSSCCFDLDSHSPLPSGWEKCLDLQTGSIYYLNRSTGLSTSFDPRKATTSSVNWPPTSPSSSSDLTFEANVPMASSSKPLANTILEGPNYESTNLNLTLSLQPSSPSLRPNSLNHSLNHDPKIDLNHNLRRLISPHDLHVNQSMSSSISSLPFNSASHIKTSFAKLPTCTTSTTSSTSPSSPSTLLFQELNVGSLGSSISSKESKCMSMNQSLNGMSRHMSSNLIMNVREKPMSRETYKPSPMISNNFRVGGKAKPIISDTRSNASSPMITVGCPNCLMFVMLPKSCSPKCPRCGASIDSDLPQPPLSIKKPKLAFSLMN